MNILTRINGMDNAEREMTEIKETLETESPSIKQLFQPGMKIVLVIGICLAIFQQVTGINVVLYYAPELFKNIGFNTEDALLQTIIVGLVNISFTVVAIWTVDKLGRKPLLLLGAGGMGVSLLALGLAFYFQQQGAWLLIFMLGFIASFASSMGPVVWVILSEIFPTKIRGRAMSIATIALWIACYVVSQTFPMMDKNAFLVERFNHGFSFWIYAIFCLITIVFVWRFVPETRGKSLEEIEKHWHSELSCTSMGSSSPASQADTYDRNSA
jgi:SP family xylose:H+ symportor-like MFS transporter